MTITQNCYKFDSHRFSVGKSGSVESSPTMYQVYLDNVISLDMMSMNVTRDELKGLADFINKYLESN